MVLRSERALLLAAAACLAAGLAGWAPAAARVLMTQDEAIKLAFGDRPPERRTAYLTDAQARRAEELAGTAPGSRVVVYDVGGPDSKHLPVAAFLDTHLVRTLPETVMIVVGPPGKVVRVDILSFDEPDDYLPAARWLDQFHDRPLSGDLSTNRAIRAVTGATLSSRAITAAVRRALALYEVLVAAPEPEPKP